MSRSSAATDDLSLPPMTRAPSSAQGSDVLPTPQDDVISLNMPHGKERIDSTAYSEPPRIHDIFVRDAPYASTARGLAPPHFASPRHEWRSYSSGDAGPNHTRTTRDLISLYEQNRSALDLSPPRVNPYAMDARRNSPMPTMPLSTYPKHRMPIRESFRNLLSAFGMKKERKDDIGAGPYIPAPVRRDDIDAQDALRLELPTDPDDDVRVRSSETVETFSIAREGPVLHLNTDDIPPRWHPCDATLHASHLSLTWSDPDGRLNRRDMVLSLCTNVKSVAANAIDPAMSPTLEQGESAHVFVMEFENGEERFATSTVSDRVGWVNAVWDGLLRCRDMSNASIERQDTGTSADAAEDIGPPLRVVNTSPASSVIEDEEPRPSRIVRSLTPNTPSIDRLDSQTLVKQRLAQFEQRFGSMTTPTAPSWKSSESSAYTPRPTRPSAQTKHDEMLAGSEEQFKAMHNVLDAAFWGDNNRPGHRKAASELPVDSATMRRRDSLRGVDSPLKRHSTDVSVPPPPIEKDTPVITTMCDLGGSRTTDSSRRTSGDPGLTRGNSNSSSLLDLQPIYDLLNEQSTKQAKSAEEVAGQIDRLRNDVSSVMKELRTTLTSPPTAQGLNDIEGRLSAVLDGMRVLQPLHAKLDKLAATQVEHRDVPRRDRPLPPVLDFGPVLSSLDELKRKARPQPPVDHTPVLEKLELFEGIHHADHTTLVQKLDELRAAVLVKDDLASIATNASQVAERDGSQSSTVVPSADIAAALAQVLERLNSTAPIAAPSPIPDTLDAVSTLAVPSPMPDAPASPSMASLRSPQSSVHAAEPGSSPKIVTLADEPAAADAPSSSDASLSSGDSSDKHAAVLSELQTLAACMKESQETSARLGTQHADSVRYLGDLNTWLGAFVNNTTANVQHVGMQIGRLHEELGIAPLAAPPVGPPAPPAPGDGEGAAEPDPQNMSNVPSAPEVAEGAARSGGLLQDMRQFLANNKGTRQAGHEELQSAMQTLVAGVAQDLDRNAQERQKISTDAIVGFMEQQRQANEALLRSIAVELSNDIRGERLRFVEAMKEATTVNIQFHVEAFKKELSKEVLNMTMEVQRLQYERQALHAQISELFAFYSKQKAVASPGNPPQEQPDAGQAPAQSMANLPPRRRRA